MIDLYTRPLRTFLSEGTGRKPDIVSPLVVHGINWLGGGVGEGKTLLACEIALTKASGRSRLGFTAVPGRVLLIGADMGPDALRDYIQVLLDTDPSRAEALENLVVSTPHGLLLDDDEGRDALTEAIQRVSPELVIFDYFANFCGSDGYGNRELRPILDMLGEIRDVMGIGVLMLDQLRKVNGQNRNEAPPIDNLIGGRAKGAIADRALFIKRDQGSGIFTLKGAKARGAGFADMNLSFDETSGWQHEGASAFRATAAEASVLACIEAAANLRPRTKEEIIGLTGLAKRTVQSALNALRYHTLIVEGPRVGRAYTYKSARVQEGATQGALHTAREGASVQSPYKGDLHPPGLHSNQDAEVASRDVAMQRFGADANDSPTLRAYAAMRPRSRIEPA
jgi:hypothetical protein